MEESHCTAPRQPQLRWLMVPPSHCSMASLLLPFDILFAAISQCDPRGLLSLALSGLWPLSKWTSVGHLQLTRRISSEPLGTTFSVKLAPPSRAALTGLSSSGHFLGTTPLRLVLMQLGFHTSVVSGLDPVGCKQVQTQLCSYSAAPHGTCQSWALTGSLWNRWMNMFTKDHLLGIGNAGPLQHLHYLPASNLCVCLNRDKRFCTAVAVFFLGWKVSWGVGFGTSAGIFSSPRYSPGCIRVFPKREFLCAHCPVMVLGGQEEFLGKPSLDLEN